MSNYLQVTLNPKTGMFETAEWLDDYYGLHQYGVRFSDGGVYDPILVELETKDIVTEVSEHSATDPEPSTSIASMPSEVDTLDETLVTLVAEVAFKELEAMKKPGTPVDSGKFYKEIYAPEIEAAKAKLSALLVEAREQGALAHAESLTARDKQADNHNEEEV